MEWDAYLSGLSVVVAEIKHMAAFCVYMGKFIFFQKSDCVFGCPIKKSSWHNL